MGIYVMCRNASASDGHLKHGAVYQVASDDGSEYQLVRVPGNWMHSRFQVVKSTGMKVKCIDNGGARTALTVGKVYEVHGDDGDEYELVGVLGTWMHARFKVVEEEASPTVNVKVGDMVECIDISNSCSGLVIGGVYQVVGIFTIGDKLRYTLKGLPANDFYASRFKLSSSTTTTSKVDEVEERCWRLLRPTVAADECCAGACKKAVCWIHKDT